MRLGGRIFAKSSNPDEWVGAVKAAGHSAAYCPLEPGAAPEEIQAYADAARVADIVIAEVGAWSNPISPDETTRRDALDKCKTRLANAPYMSDCVARVAPELSRLLSHQWVLRPESPGR